MSRIGRRQARVPHTPVAHNTSRRSVTRNIATSYAATFASMFAGFLVTPVLYRSLGADGFGVVAIVVSVAGFALLADLGVGTAILRRVAAAVAAHDDDALARTIASSRQVMRGAGGVATCALLVVAWRLPAVVDVPDRLVGEARWSLVLLALTQGIFIAWSTPTAVVVGHGRADLHNRRSLVVGLLSASGQCVVALAGGGVLGITAVVGASAIATSAIGVHLQRRVLERPLPVVRAAPGEVRDLLREGAVNFLISVGGMVSYTSDTLVLGALAPFAAVATYALAARLPGLVAALSGKLIEALVPTYSHLATVGEGSDQSLAILRRSTVLSAGMAICGGLVSCACTGVVLRLWIGEVPDGAVTVVWVLMAGAAFKVAGHAVFVLLTGMRRLRGLALYSLSSAAVNVTLSVVLTARLGVVGPALASLVCVLLGDLVAGPVLAGRALGVSAVRILLDLVVRPTMPVVPAVAVLLLAGVPTGSWWSLLPAAVAVAVYSAGYWLALRREDRRWLLEIVRPRPAGPTPAGAPTHGGEPVPVAASPEPR